MTVHAEIIGVGAYLPDRRLTNKDLEQMVDTSDEWITTRTGIKERRIAADDESSSTLGTRAAERAIADAGIEAAEIDQLVVGTSSPDMIFPATACLIQDSLGLTCPAHDVQAACAGFVFALECAVAAIESGRARTVLVVGAETLSKHIDFTDRTTCVLFGDGAGAIVLRASGEPGVLGISLGSDGAGADVLSIPAGGSAQPVDESVLHRGDHFLKMNGNEVFKFAVRVVPKVTREALEQSGLTADDLTWLIPHQANQRIIDTMADRLGMPHERVVSTISHYGNTSTASIPLALDDLYTSGQLQPGDLVGLVGFGAGLTWGAAIVRWTKARTSKEAQ
jgi:3-oxoacyl-[acyl-carrier-protein] synthase-3